MSGKSTFVDYDPLTRKGSGKSAEQDVDGGVSQLSPRGSFEARFGGSAPLVDAEVLPDNPVPLDKGERWIFKQGHTVSYIGLFLFTFLVYFRPYELFPSLSWLASSAFWVAIFTVAVFVPTQLGLENRITIRPREVNLVLLLATAGLLSIAFALDRRRAWNSLLDYLKVVLVFIVAVNVVRTEKRLKALMALVLVGTCVLSFSALNDYRLGKLALKGERISGIIGGLFDNPNDLALHLVTMIPIAVGWFLGTRALWRKLFLGTCALLAVVGVVVTFSRGGFIAMLCVGGTLAWRLSRRNKVLIPLALLAVLALLVFAPGGYRSRLTTTSDGSFLARQDDLKRSLFIAARHPVLGVGMDNYILFSNSDHATHNAYTQVAAELGLAAAVVYVMFLLVPLRRLRKIQRETYSARRESHLYYLALGLEASLIGYMVSSFFASVAYLWYAYYLVAYAICVWNLHEMEVPQEAPSTKIV